MLMEQQTEQRESKRLPVAARAEIRLSTGVLIEGAAVNLSLNGMLFSTERTLPLHHDVHATVILRVGGEECRIDTRGVVARLGDSEVAIQFTHISADNLSHLRQLVIYDAGQTRAAQRIRDTRVGKKNGNSR